MGAWVGAMRSQRRFAFDLAQWMNLTLTWTILP
jgi:hypothetical protein